MDTPYEKLLVSLALAKVRFIIVGGVAVALNGFIRTTEDVDILIERSPDNIETLLTALGSFGKGHARELVPEDFDETEGAVRVIEEFPLDIFVVMQGNSYHDLIRETSQTEIKGTPVTYLNAAGLIRLKQNSSREKDRIDIAALKDAQLGHLNRESG